MTQETLLIIETSRLNLICCTKEILEAIFKGDKELGEFLQVNIPQPWTECGEPAFRWTYDKLSEPKATNKWLCYLPVLKSENMLVGTCGFKGEPKDGMVEIGYEIARDYRNRGLASELAKALVQYAFQHPEVSKVQAHTLAEENESGSVLKKAGMKKVEELEDPEDGKIWRWEILK